jgi:hypothetical protein
MSESPAFKTFLLKRESTDSVAAEFPATDADKQGAALAVKLEDPQAALEHVLGPELHPIGSGAFLISEQVKAITEHKYGPDRYLYKEGLKLAAKYAEEEKALAEALEAAYGPDVDVKAFQANPRTPVQTLLDHQKAVAARSSEFAAAKQAAGDAYSSYAVTKKQQCKKSDESNDWEQYWLS